MAQGPDRKFHWFPRARGDRPLTALRAAKRNPPKGGYSLGLLKSPTGDTAKKACSAQHKSGGFSPDGHLFRRLQSAIQNHGVKSRFAPSFDTRTMNNLMTLKRKRRRKSGEKGLHLKTNTPWPRFQMEKPPAGRLFDPLATSPWDKPAAARAAMSFRARLNSGASAS